MTWPLKFLRSKGMACADLPLQFSYLYPRMFLKREIMFSNKCCRKGQRIFRTLCFGNLWNSCSTDFVIFKTYICQYLHSRQKVGSKYFCNTVERKYWNLTIWPTCCHKIDIQGTIVRVLIMIDSGSEQTSYDMDIFSPDVFHIYWP